MIIREKTITIQVLDTETERGNRGTFIGPPPHVKVNLGDNVTFNVIPDDSTFSVNFVGLSPFQNNLLVLTDSNPTAVVRYPGHYHYQVSVTLSNGDTFRITSC